MLLNITYKRIYILITNVEITIQIFLLKINN